MTPNAQKHMFFLKNRITWRWALVTSKGWFNSKRLKTLILIYNIFRQKSTEKVLNNRTAIRFYFVLKFYKSDFSTRSDKFVQIIFDTLNKARVTIFLALSEKGPNIGSSGKPHNFLTLPLDFKFSRNVARRKQTWSKRNNLYILSITGSISLQ